VIAEPLVLKPNYRWAYALSVLLLPTIAASQTVKNSAPMEMRDPSVYEAKSVENDLPIEVKLRGIVKDIHDEALVGTLIRLKGTEIGTLTDLEGLFQLEFSSKEITHNTFEIEVIYAGFDTASVKINRNQVQEEFKIILKEAPLPFTVVEYQRIGKVCISRDYGDGKLSTKHRIKNLFRKKKRD
jgi:CarboxypepD_reg-like domain